ncbi:MAG: pyridoxal phosphate-dependent aminotransferase [Candidatus Acidiferrales bacterium]
MALELRCDPSEIIDFSANINHRGLPLSALSALAEMVGDPSELLRYPDWVSHPLRRILADRLNVSPETIVLHAGASALIADIIRAVRARTCAVFVPAFAEYRRACESCGTRLQTIPLEEADGFRIRCETVARVLRTVRPELLIVNNPHNPSGRLTAANEIYQLADEAVAAGAVVLIDEAFIDYAPEHQVTATAAKQPGIIAVRSLTKFYGCPGLRIGYAVAHSAMAHRVERQMPAWPIGSIALETMTAALHDVPYAASTLAETARERAWLASEIAELGLHSYESAANFLLLKMPHNWPNSGEIRRQFLERSRILVRDCASFDGLENGRFIRVAVLSRDQNQRLVDAMFRFRKGLL